MKILKAIIIGIIALSATALAAYFFLDSPVNPGAGTTTFTVKKGEGIYKIGQNLQAAGIIRSGAYFAFISRAGGRRLNIQTGMFDVSASMTTRDVAEKMSATKAKNETYKITIPEGFTAQQIAERVESHNLCSASEFEEIVENPSDYDISSPLFTLDNLEGFLFPETYFVDGTTTCQGLAARMVEQFHKIFQDGLKERAANSGMTVRQIVTLASLIEKEARVPSERAIISGVLQNRLKTGMLLQCDASIQYVLPKREQKLYLSHLQIDSPYNTYLHPGLPPGPICNPGRASIESAINPQSTPYFFYVARGDGSHVFSRTGEEHEQAKQRIKRESNGY